MNQEFLSLSVTYCTVLILYSNDIYTCIPQGNPGRRSRNINNLPKILHASKSYSNGLISQELNYMV